MIPYIINNNKEDDNISKKCYPDYKNPPQKVIDKIKKR